MENNAKIVSLIMQAIRYIIEKNPGAVCNRSTMATRTKKMALVKEYNAIFLSIPQCNLFIRVVEKTHLEGYPYGKNDFQQDAFKVLDNERQLIKDKDEYHIILLEGDMVIGYGSIANPANDFIGCFEDTSYWQPNKIHLKSDNGFLLRTSPDGRDGSKARISIATLKELEAIHKLVTNFV